MTTMQFLAEWAVRSSVLILGGALLLWALRVKASSIRLAAWTAMLCGSAAIPALTVALPKMSVPVMRAAAPMAHFGGAPEPPISIDGALNAAVVPKAFDWTRAALIAYAMVAGALLLRIGTGLAMSLRLRRASRATGQATDGIEIRESEWLESPVALGIARPAILLPVDWRQWDDRKLQAVLAHERSHIRRYDPAVQLLSAIHRALLWFSPASWFLHQRLVRVAEEASDDAAVESTCDRALYAKVLLEFIERGGRRASWVGVPMARYGRPDRRIHRILDATPRRGLTRWSAAAILALGMPLVYMVAAAGPTVEPPVQVETAAVPERTPVEVAPSDPNIIRGLGAVTPTTATIKPRVDGELLSVNFKEGETVQAGQLLATIDPRPYQLQLAQAEDQLALDRAHNADSLLRDQARLDLAKLQWSYTQIFSPITGVAGLRQVDPGNVVRAADSTAIVVIVQLRPISVLFTVPEDNVRQIVDLVTKGVNLPVEAWDRTNTRKFATGRLVGFDNQIDSTTGALTLKAVFDNKDGALYPGQFVNVSLLLSGK